MRRFEGTKKCAYCGKELTQDEISGYHNDLIEEVSSELHYSIIT